MRTSRGGVRSQNKTRGLQERTLWFKLQKNTFRLQKNTFRLQKRLPNKKSKNYQKDITQKTQSKIGSFLWLCSIQGSSLGDLGLSLESGPICTQKAPIHQHTPQASRRYHSEKILLEGICGESTLLSSPSNCKQIEEYFRPGLGVG